MLRGSRKRHRQWEAEPEGTPGRIGALRALSDRIDALDVDFRNRLTSRITANLEKLYGHVYEGEEEEYE
jgi:hypothetical protein